MSKKREQNSTIGICGFKTLETGVPGWSSGGARRTFSVDRDPGAWATADAASGACACMSEAPLPPPPGRGAEGELGSGDGFLRSHVRPSAY